mmetsp:Transcript_32187/g.72629  ORF Transcript_32187/g.72629 Transcript_32187/m.72629 type:complete len:200 (+) Transcript_32187:286-885(+)
MTLRSSRIATSQFGTKNASAFASRSLSTRSPSLLSSRHRVASATSGVLGTSGLATSRLPSGTSSGTSGGSGNAGLALLCGAAGFSSWALGGGGGRRAMEGVGRRGLVCSFGDPRSSDASLAFLASEVMGLVRFPLDAFGTLGEKWFWGRGVDWALGTTDSGRVACDGLSGRASCPSPPGPPPGRPREKAAGGRCFELES